MKPIPVLWLDRHGAQSDLEFHVLALRRPPTTAALALTIVYPDATDELAPRLMDSAKELPSSSFLLDREAVYQLYKSLGRWLQVTPMSPDDVQRVMRNATTRIVSAPTTTVNDLGPYVDRVVAAIKTVFGLKAMYITDESRLSDFGNLEPEMYTSLSEALGITIDPGDDSFIVKIAQRLKDATAKP